MSLNDQASPSTSAVGSITNQADTPSLPPQGQPHHPHPPRTPEHSPFPNNHGRIAASLHVSELDPRVDESTLEKLFTTDGVSKVVSVKVVRDRFTGQSLGYGYVNFETDEQARVALDKYNFTKLIGRVIRISFTKDRSVLTKQKRNSEANLYVKNLDYSIDTKALYELFKGHGEITSCRVMEYPDGTSKGFGFVAYEHIDAAQIAMDALNNATVKGKTISVSIAQSKVDRAKDLEARYGPVYYGPGPAGGGGGMMVGPPSPSGYPPMVHPYSPVYQGQYGMDGGVYMPYGPGPHPYYGPPQYHYQGGGYPSPPVPHWQGVPPSYPGPMDSPPYGTYGQPHMGPAPTSPPGAPPSQ